MKARGQPPDFSNEAKTLWLAAGEKGQQTGLLPFGWLLVEVGFPTPDSSAENAPLKSACETQLAPARRWASAIAAKQRAMDEARARVEARRREDEETARQRAVATALAARIEAERQARLAAMSEEERAVEALRKFYENEAQRGVLKSGSATVGKLNELLKAADSRPAPARRSLADLAEQIFSHKLVGWGSGEKKRERKERIASIREKS